MYRKLLGVSVEEPLTPYIRFSIRFILYKILIVSKNFKTFEEYLRELESEQSDGLLITFQLCWKVLKISCYEKWHDSFYRTTYLCNNESLTDHRISYTHNILYN